MPFPSSAPTPFPQPLDLNEHLITKPATTFMFEVEDDSGSFLGFDAGDLLIVDRSISIAPDQIVVAVYNDEFGLFKLIEEYRQISIRLSQKYVRLLEETEVDIWGVVTGLVRQFS